MLAITGEPLPRYYSLTPVLVQAADLPTIQERPLSMIDLAEFYTGWGSTDEFLEEWMDTWPPCSNCVAQSGKAPALVAIGDVGGFLTIGGLVHDCM